MSFYKRREDVPTLWKKYEDPAFYDAEVISVLYETKFEVLEKIVPPPFGLFERPYVLFNYNIFPRTNFGIPYIEPSLMLPVKYKGVAGMYTQGMILTEEIGIVLGRNLGYPKKLGQAEYHWQDDVFDGNVSRHGITIASVSVDFSPDVLAKEEESGAVEKAKAAFAEIFKLVGDKLPEYPGHEAHGVNWLHFNPLDSQGTRWDEMMSEDAPAVQVVAGWKTADPKEPARYGKGTLKYNWSDDDPWAEFTVERIIGARRTVSDVKLLQGDVVDEIPASVYAPYAYKCWDAYHEKY